MQTSAKQTRYHRPTGKTLLKHFRDYLLTQVGNYGFSVDDWAGGRRSQNIVRLVGPETKSILYIKTRSDSIGFWGLNNNQLKSLRSSNLKWFVIFLLGPKEKGYLLSSGEVEMAISRNRWSYSKSRGIKGDYKIHEGPELTGIRNYNRYGDLISEIVKSIKG